MVHWFECLVCSARMTDLCALESHLAQMHVLLYPYKCITCKIPFSTQEIANAHMQNRHPQEEAKELISFTPNAEKANDVWLMLEHAPVKATPHDVTVQSPPQVQLEAVTKAKKKPEPQQEEEVQVAQPLSKKPKKTPELGEVEMTTKKKGKQGEPKEEVTLLRSKKPKRTSKLAEVETVTKKRVKREVLEEKEVAQLRSKKSKKTPELAEVQAATKKRGKREPQEAEEVSQSPAKKPKKTPELVSKPTEVKKKLRASKTETPRRRSGKGGAKVCNFTTASCSPLRSTQPHPVAACVCCVKKQSPTSIGTCAAII